MLRIDNPGPIFLNASGTLLNGGYVYVGEAGGDPITSPAVVYYDKAMTMVAAQPLRTVGGSIVNESLSPTNIYVDADDYSLLIRDSLQAQINYYASARNEDVTFQPLNDELTAIALLQTTSFGRALLTLADQAGLRDATGIPDSLPLAGGTVSGDISRQGAGKYWYNINSAFSGRVYHTPSGAADPTSSPGDTWIELTL